MYSNKAPWDIGIRIAVAGRWKGVTRFWPLVAESWAVVVIPTMGIVGGSVANSVAGLHLVVGFALLGGLVFPQVELSRPRARRTTRWAGSSRVSTAETSETAAGRVRPPAYGATGLDRPCGPLVWSPPRGVPHQGHPAITARRFVPRMDATGPSGPSAGETSGPDNLCP